MKKAEIEKLCKGYGASLRDIFGGQNYSIWHNPEQYGITIVDDESEDDYNAENTTCVLLDIQCSDGIARVGYYSDGAWCVLDWCDGCDSISDWAGGWDEDGLLPNYLKSR